MDLEANRIPTRLSGRNRLPHIPVTAPFATILPSTVYTGNRMASTATAFVLRALGVEDEVLASSENATDAMEEHTNARIPRGLFAKADELWAKKRVKKAYEQLKADLSANSNFLTEAFGDKALTVAKAEVEKVLCSYTIVDNSD